MGEQMNKEIVEMAKYVKENGVKTKINNFEKTQYSQLFAMQILNIKKNKFKILNGVHYEEKIIGDEFTEDIYYKDYFSMIKRFYNFVHKNKRLPNYILTSKSKKRLNINKFINLMSRVIVFYNNNKRYPNYVAMKKTEDVKTSNKSVTKTSTKKPTHTYLKTKGCSGMGQCTSYFCACNSLQQVFHKLCNKDIQEKTIASWAGTTSKGTSHQGINTAIAIFNRKYKKSLKIKWVNFSDLGKTDKERWNKLNKYLMSDKYAIITHIKYRLKWGHYEIPEKVKGNSIIVLNSLGTKNANGTYQGYEEKRSLSEELKYFKAISQPSIAIISL